MSSNIDPDNHPNVGLYGIHGVSVYKPWVSNNFVGDIFYRAEHILKFLVRLGYKNIHCYPSLETLGFRCLYADGWAND